MYNIVEQLNRILTPYDQLLLIDCGCVASRGSLLAIACGFLVVITSRVVSLPELILLTTLKLVVNVGIL